MSNSIAQLRERTRARLNAVLQSLGEEVAEPRHYDALDDAPGLLSDHQHWLFHERADLQAGIDLSLKRDQARFTHWWLHHVPIEYGGVDEAIGWGHLSSPYDPSAGPFATLVTRLMQKSYWLDDKLRDRFDLTTRHGRVMFIDWFFRRGLFDEKLDGTPYVHHILAELSARAGEGESDLPINKFAAFVVRRFPAEFKDAAKEGFEAVEASFAPVLNRKAPELLFLYNMLSDGIRPVNRKLSLRLIGDAGDAPGAETKGVNLIGYAHGAFGMGEHVRMTARALSVWSDDFSIIDIPSHGHTNQPEPDIEQWAARTERYGTNIFHANADAMAGTLTTIGPSQGQGRYNIGYWAWELSKVPEAWRPSIDYVDEIWAPSRFIQQAFQEATDKPVLHMPLCVDLSFDSWKRRAHFGLPQDKFLFLYYFDSYSYYQRKNPFAALRAFKRAFPDREDVGLVIKTQNASAASIEWQQLLDMAGDDPRVHILNKVMSKGEVMSLQAECDCFVSLHRSEGFGRGPAEALWLGKPTIVTGYSGNMDFTTAENSLLVDYAMVPVKATEYPFHKGQSWADPDEDNAAHQMRRLVEEPGLARTLGRNGARLMREAYNFSAIGRRYAERLKEIRAL